MSDLARGQLIASLLRGAWRTSPPPLPESSLDLYSVAPLLCQSGAAPLVWWRLQRTQVPVTPAAHLLRRMFHLHAAEAVFQQQGLVQVVEALRSAGVEPILVKGWSVARLYAVPGLRPFTDIDLCIPPSSRSLVEATLAGLGPARLAIDLHTRIVDMPDRRWQDLAAHAVEVPLDRTTIRVLGMEDHLRFLGLHWLRHGARRPIWLCDVALILESHSSHLDWAYCLSGEARRSTWLLGVIGLARQLLGAEVVTEPLLSRPVPDRDWVTTTVLRQWGRDAKLHSTRGFRRAVRRIRSLPANLQDRWPNPIEAVYGLDGGIDLPSPLSYQAAYFTRRAITFLAGRPYGLEPERSPTGKPQRSPES